LFTKKVHIQKISQHLSKCVRSVDELVEAYNKGILISLITMPPLVQTNHHIEPEIPLYTDQTFLSCLNFKPSIQSAYRRTHLTETALLKMLSDIAEAFDEGS